MIDIDDIGHVRVETLQCPSRYFSVECANAQLLVGEIVQQRAGDGRLTNTALVSAYQYNCRLCHSEPLIHFTMVKPLSSANPGRAKDKSVAFCSAAYKV